MPNRSSPPPRPGRASLPRVPKKGPLYFNATAAQRAAIAKLLAERDKERLRYITDAIDLLVNEALAAREQKGWIS